MTAVAYEDDREHLRAELARLDLLLRRHLAAWRAERGGAGDHGGLYVSGEQVDALLAAPTVRDDRGEEAADRTTGHGAGRAARDATEQRDADWASTAHGEPAESRERVTQFTEAIRDAAATIAARERATVEAGDAPRLTTLAGRFDLDRTARDALLVALAPELDLKYEKVYAHLQDDLTRKRPTVGLVLRVLEGTAGGAFEHRSLFTGADSLVADGLVARSGAEGSLLSQYVEVDRRIAAYVLGSDEPDGRLAGVAELVDPPAETRPALDERARSAGEPSAGSEGTDASGTDAKGTNASGADAKGTNASGTDAKGTNASGADASSPAPADRLPFDEALLRDVEQVAERVAARPKTLVALSGPPGSGLERAVRVVCARLDTPVLTAQADRLQSQPGDDPASRLVREARLADAAIHVGGLSESVAASSAVAPARSPPGGESSDALDVGTAADGAAAPTDSTSSSVSPDGSRSRLVRALTAADGPILLTGTAPFDVAEAGSIESHDVVTVEVEPPSFEVRRRRWANAELPAGVDPDDLAATYQLTPGQIDDALASARALSLDGEPTAASIRAGCRAQSRERLGDLATSIEPRYELGDVVLPEDERQQLETVLAHVEQRGRVFSEWGFEERRGSSGVNVLFTGPSGTGKTMAAEIVANETGLDCYRVDLAAVVSKYVGETEGNLRRIFDEAADSNAVLLFDEADALFGERTEVQDAHDRYANVEVNYLLQRMEAHDGVVILTTNLGENVDDAFRRRIDVDIAFPMPDADARERIWRSVFPDATPREDLDWSFLASFDLAGGDIDAAASTAAFLAAAEDAELVTMDHVVEALYRELRKSGRLISAAEFGEYGDLIR